MDEPPPTRFKQMEADGIEPDLPPLSVPALFDTLMEIGPVATGGMDRAPLGWSDIRAWQEVTGSRLLPWAARLIRRLSTEYLSESRRAESIDAIAPFTIAERTETSRQAVNRKLASLFGG